MYHPENVLFEGLDLAASFETEVRLADFTCDYSMKDRALIPETPLKPHCKIIN